MARKTTDTLNLTPLDRAWASYLEAEAKQEEVERQTAKLIRPDGGTLRKGVTQEEFNTALRAIDQRQRIKFQTFDAWNALRKRESDVTLSNVPREDAKSLIVEAVTESAMPLQFSLNYGLIAHKLSEAAYGFVVREEEMEAPLCPACAWDGS